MAKRNKSGKQTHMKEQNKRKIKINSKSQTSTSFKHKSTASSNPYRPDPSGGKPGSRFRDRATINRLNMYTQKPDMEKLRKRPTDP